MNKIAYLILTLIMAFSVMPFPAVTSVSANQPGYRIDSYKCSEGILSRYATVIIHVHTQSSLHFANPTLAASFPSSQYPGEYLTGTFYHQSTTLLRFYYDGYGQRINVFSVVYRGAVY